MGANPRNNPRLEGTFAAVERLDDAYGGREEWRVVRTDEDWGLVFRWERLSTVLGTSEARVEWEIEDEDGIEPGLHRMRYFGDAKRFGGGIHPFDGLGGEFWVVGPRTENMSDPETARGGDHVSIELELGRG